MKILERIKWFIYEHLPATKGELMEFDEMLLELVDSVQEYELLMRNDMRLMFNAMNKPNEKKPGKKTKSNNDRMFG